MPTNSRPTKRWWQFWKSNRKQGDDPRINDLLLTIRQTQDLSKRYQAAGELRTIADRRAVAPLLAALQEQDSYVREVAVEILGRVGDPRAVAPLVALIKDKGPYESPKNAAWMAHSTVREQAVKALGQIGGRRAVVSLIGMLSEGSFAKTAATALGQLGDTRAVDPLLRTLASVAPQAGGSSYESSVACAAATALGQLGDTRAVGPLVDVLSNRSERLRVDVFSNRLRKAALIALTKLDPSSALKRCAVALSDKDREVRMCALHVLQETQPSQIPWDTQTVKSLITILESGTSSEASAAADEASAAAEILAGHDSPEIQRALTAYHNQQANYRSQLAQQSLDMLLYELRNMKGERISWDHPHPEWLAQSKVRERDIRAELGRRGVVGEEL